MLIQKKKRTICIGLMLVLTTFVGMTTNASANQPPVADAGGPYTDYECYPILLDASASYDPDGDPLTYTWYIEGEMYFNGNNPFFEWIWLDDFSGEVTLSVSDGTSTSTDTALVTILNSPPTDVSVDGPTEVAVDEEFVLWVTFFDGYPDPRGDINSTDTYTATFYWGDGSSTEMLLGVEEFEFSASHIYAEEGDYIITIVIIDDDGDEVTIYWYILVFVVLQLVDAGPDGEINEGSEFISAGFLADDEGSYTAQVDYGDGTGTQDLTLNPENTFDLLYLYCDNGVYTLVVTAFNEGEYWGEGSATVTVHNVPPTIESLSVSPSGPVHLGTPILLTSSFSDPGCFDTHTATIEWGDGETTTISLTFGTYVVTASHTYASVGDYVITLNITDDDGGFDSETLETLIQIIPAAYEGLSHGYWMNHNNWPEGYTKSMRVIDVFENANLYVLSSDTLQTALKYTGGPGKVGAARILLRNAVASVLNARHPFINYPMLEADVIAAVNAALASQNRQVMLDLEEILDEYNNLGADLTQ